jgi:hypothetical protein
MISAGHNGWYQSNLKKGSPDNFNNQFKVAFNLTEPIRKLNFQDASDYTAQLIAKKYNNLHLLLSGGLDSEYVAKVLLRNNIKFIPIIVLTPMNGAEHWYAFKFCEENSLIPIVLDYTGDKYHDLLNEVIKVSLRLHLNIQWACLPNAIVRLVSNIKLLTGFGEPFANSCRFNTPMGDKFDLGDNFHWLDLEYGDSHPSAFFTYTPELFRSMISEIDTSKNTQIAKAMLYDVIPRSKTNCEMTSYCNSKVLQSIVDNVIKKVYNPNRLSYILIDKIELLNQLEFRE